MNAAANESRRIDPKRIREEELRELAKPGCSKCDGTGKLGNAVASGKAIHCGCVRRRFEKNPDGTVTLRTREEADAQRARGLLEAIRGLEMAAKDAEALAAQKYASGEGQRRLARAFSERIESLRDEATSEASIANAKHILRGSLLDQREQLLAWAMDLAADMARQARDLVDQEEALCERAIELEGRANALEDSSNVPGGAFHGLRRVEKELHRETWPLLRRARVNREKADRLRARLAKIESET